MTDPDELTALISRLRPVVEYAGDIRWQELGEEGAPFTVIDRQMLSEMHRMARSSDVLATLSVTDNRAPVSTPAGEGGGRWRPEIAAFADLMERQLRANDHKPGWKRDDPLDLLERVVDETEQLVGAVRRHIAIGKDLEPSRGSDPCWRNGVAHLIGREAADVANFAMMVADVCSALPDPAQPATGTDEGLREAADWLRAISTWLLTHDHDMCLPDGVLETDPLDIADRLAALSADNRAPVEDGWRLVPVEPTEAMVAFGYGERGNLHPADSWARMLAAAPTPPTGSREDGR